MANPKVLVIGINPWIDNTGINTLINFFKDWGVDSIAHMYTRDQLPNTVICQKFFRISENRLINSVWNRSIKTGEMVENTETAKSQSPNALYQKKHSEWMTLAREVVWKLGKWHTKELDTFLDEFSPDVIFCPVYSTVYMCRLQNYVANRTKKPIVLYVSDDNYSYQSIAKTPVAYLSRFWLRHQEKKLFERAKKVLVIAPKQKEEYDRLFHTDCGILTKGIDFSQYPYKEKELNDPIRMVYTGKLIIGRWKSLAAIADAMGKINSGRTKVVLNIYTTDELTDEQKTALNRNGCQVCGALPLNEVQAVQEDADILVFAECLEDPYRYTARLSFSTKVTDYLRAGKCIFAIGDKDIAPIDYFTRYDSAVTATSYEEVYAKLQMLVDRPELITEYGKKGYECGRAHHDEQKMSQLLTQTIMDAARK